MIIEHFETAFESYLYHPDPNAFLIIEDQEGRFLQFTRENDGLVLDLPTQGLTADQAILANALIVGELGGERHALPGGQYAYQLRLRAEARSLAQTSLEVFGRIHRTAPALPLHVTIDS